MLKLIAAAAAAGLALPAAATAVLTINESGDTTDVPFYQSSQSFVLPSNFTRARLNIAHASADDLIVVSVNGTPVFGTGLGAPGAGYVFYSADGDATPFNFTIAPGTINQSFTGPFVAGTNTVTLTVNNNDAGINPEGRSLSGGAGNYALSGSVTAGVPEPAVWGLMVAGFGLIGVGTRRRTVSVAA
jgi:hypothetical protein